MSRTLPFLVLSALLFVVGEARSQELTLNEVVRLALVRNERARIAGLNVQVAEASLARARAGFMPSVTMTGSETLRPYTIEQNGRVTSRSNAANGTLSVNQPILALAQFPLHASAKRGLEAARYGQVDLRRQLCFDAVRAFFAVIAQQRLLKAAKGRLQRAENSLADTHARVQAQLVSSNDETRATVERANSLQSVASAGAALEQARINLEYILDSQIPAELNPPAERLVPPSFNPSALANQALAQRPDLASARENAAAASHSADEPGMRFVPTLNAQGQARVSDQAIAGTQYWDTTVALNLTWQIWDAGTRNADTMSRRAAADTAELQVRALKRKIQADVRAAAAQLAAARAVLQAAEGGVEAANKSAEETEVLYKQGLAKAIELFNSNQSKFDAEVSLAAAQLGLRQAELDMRAALGLFPIDGVQ
ncbi:MAG: TolC family protein [Deltaproteobacteria bacterium]|nr:TolC family protein [Deltaproteobacteria bacterium]